MEKYKIILIIAALALIWILLTTLPHMALAADECGPLATDYWEDGQCCTIDSKYGSQTDAVAAGSAWHNDNPDYIYSGISDTFAAWGYPGDDYVNWTCVIYSKQNGCGLGWDNQMFAFCDGYEEPEEEGDLTEEQYNFLMGLAGLLCGFMFWFAIIINI